MRSGLESYARRQGVRVITAELMQEGMQGDGRPAFAGMPAFVKDLRRPGDAKPSG